MKRLVDVVDGVTETLHYDEMADTFSIHRTADITAVADDVAAKHSQTLGKTELGWHIGAIPVSLLEQYAQMRGIANPWDLCTPAYADELLALCTNADFRKFSPTGGRA
jgi:hypothetical protein